MESSCEYHLEFYSLKIPVLIQNCFYIYRISHDMRLISQCAEKIYICDKKKITLYKGDIMDFKLHTKGEVNKKLSQHQNG